MSLNDHPAVKRYRELAASRPPGGLAEKIDAGRIKTLAREAGADDAALVEMERPDISDQRADILGIFPRAKSLVSLVCRMNRENIRCPSRDVSDLEFLRTFEKINEVSRLLARRLEGEGVRALYFSGGFPMNMAKWPGKMWPISHKTIAVAGGLGKIGHHRLVIHPRFGSFVVLGTLLLDREATAYDQPLDYNPCLECRLCVAVCPVGAIAADGHFNFTACLTHNYRDRLGGFQDWVEQVVASRSVSQYRRRVGDPETASLWQSLSYGICNKSSYCLAVCPAGEEVLGPFLDDRQAYVAEVVKPFQDKEEAIYVVPGSDAESFVPRRFPHKKVRLIGNGLRAGSAKSFLESLPIIFQREQSEGLNAAYHFTFTGDEDLTGTVVIKDRQIEVLPGHAGKADLSLTADSKSWLDFLAKEKGLLPALLRRKIRIKGSPRLMKQFARCFPS